MLQLRKKSGLRGNSMKRYGLKLSFCIFWNSSDVPQDRLLKQSLAVFSDFYYHTLTDRLLIDIVPTTPKQEKIADKVIYKNLLITLS